MYLMTNFYSIQADKMKFNLDMLVDMYKIIDQTKWVHRQDKLFTILDWMKTIHLIVDIKIYKLLKKTYMLI